ncbi:MAG TPA: helix-turn-helix transcriptional regulator [Solirubrobacteraceae bacterium]|nr:helix-turn-helix transcriptional regulator [Solirubrobacteraceae bacterium]
MAATDTSTGFGGLLREWRHRRSVSQLELSLDANLSARHLSFVETGRSRPSREVVVRLAECLQIPLRERNALLLAAGYAPIYGERRYDSPEMEPVRDALERFLRAHEPYPALVIDRRHNLLSANDALLALTEGCAAHLLDPPANVVRVALHPEGLAPRTENLAEWSSHLLARLRREAAVTRDRELEELYDEVSRYPGVALDAPTPERPAGEIAVPLRLRLDGEVLSFMSTISTFGTAVDVTLSELSIEAFYPANAQTALLMLRQLEG